MDEPAPPGMLSGNAKGILFMLFSAAAVSCMTGVIRYLSDTLHPFEIAFFRNFFGLIFLAPMVLQAGTRHLRTSKAPFLVGRGLLSAIAMLCYFYGVSIAPLAEVTALSFMGPLFATIFAVLILREKLHLRRTVALIIGFCGALIILRPGFQEIGLGSVLILCSAAAWSICMIIIKVLTRTESSVTQSVYTALVLAPITGLVAIAEWQWPSLLQLFWLAVMAGLGTVGQLAFTESFKAAELTTVLPLDFTKLIWASLIGYLIFAQMLDIWVLVGGTVIFAAATYISIREARLNAEKLNQQIVMPDKTQARSRQEPNKI